VFGALVLGISRNPSLRDELFKTAILGFALTEAIALFSLFDIADRARLPWRFFGVAKSNLRPRLHG
jgi:hypothetical protein